MEPSTTDSSHDLGALDRATRAVATRLSRRTVLKGGVFGVVGGLLSLKMLAPTNASACGGCHYCVSGTVTSCSSSLGCRSGNGTYHLCAVGTFPGCLGWCLTGGGRPFYIKNYICDGYCQSWCAYQDVYDFGQCTTS
jgi:hypothetical protein